MTQHHVDLEILYENKQGMYKLTRKELDSDFIDQLIVALEYNNSVTHIVFYQNEMGDANAIRISNTLSKKANIQCVYFWNNNITNDGCLGIVQSMSNSNISHLDLSRNHIGDIGAQYIVDYFYRHGQLTSLDLSYNQITDVGSLYIAKNIGKTFNVSKLNLSNNIIGNESAKEWIKVLKQYSCVYEIILHGNSIDPNYLLMFTFLNSKNKKRREKQAVEVWRACRNLLFVSIPLPNELIQKILDYCTDSFTKKEAKILLGCLLDRSFIGWVSSPLPFTADELLRRCLCLQLYQPDFQKLWELKVQRKDAQIHCSKLYSTKNRHERLVNMKRWFRYSFLFAIPIVYVLFK